jgi:hypothetical protein
MFKDSSQGGLIAVKLSPVHRRGLDIHTIDTDGPKTIQICHLSIKFLCLSK